MWTGNASEAYRRAYDAQRMSDRAIRVEACRLKSNPNVALAIARLQEAHRSRHRVSVDGLTRDLEEARRLAMGRRAPAAAVAAVMAKARLHGLVGTTQVRQPAGQRNVTIAWSDTEPAKA
ncbi:MAG: hypothetical protein Kow0032_00030 [Methyloligellaceae bacterium]